MSKHEEIREIVRRCGKSVTFFVQNFCKIKHPTIGIMSFELFSYQKRCLKEFRENRFNCFKKCRQSGISTLCGAYALWTAMFFNDKTILVVSKTDEDAKTFLNRNIKFLYNHLPDWMKSIWETPINNEHQLGFPNGSVIRSLTSAPNALRSNASSLNIIDEAAFIADMETMWSGGWSCINPSTQININGQLTEIGDLGDLNGEKWQNIDVEIQSDNEIQKSDKLYLNGVADTFKIKTFLGFELECTGNHRLKDENYEWIYTENIKIDQKLALKCGSDFNDEWAVHLNKYELKQLPLMEGYKNSDIIIAKCSYLDEDVDIQYRQYKRNHKKNGTFISQKASTILNFSNDFNKPDKMTPELAELIGYYVGDGWASTSRPKRLRLAYDPQDEDIYNYFAIYLKSLKLNPLQHHSNGAMELRIDNAHFVDWWKLNKFNSKTSAHDTEIPQLILKSPKSIRAAFLRGLFEADGWNCKYRNTRRPNIKRRHIGFSSVSEKLVKQVQLTLLDLGIISKKSNSKGGYENSGPSWRLELPNLDEMIKFMDIIGFISKRKNQKIIKHIKYSPRKYSIDENGIFYDKIVKIEKSKSFTVDVSVPKNNTYVANGFISHNTLQHGGHVIVVSTPNGLGNWYWKTWTDAVEHKNNFNPIEIKWYEMDWALTYKDPITNTRMRIAPIDNLRKCETTEEIEKFGEFWSPWLEGEYKGLQQRGKGHLFKQEILAEFLGSGGTVLSPSAIRQIQKRVEESVAPKIAVEIQPYIHPITGETEHIDFNGPGEDEGLYIWEQPVHPIPSKTRRNRIIKQGIPGHVYVMGVDVATGKNDDYSAIQVFDVDTMEQVAEYMGRPLCIPFSKMVDYIGRWYNNALAVVENTGIGNPFIQNVEALAYPNLWRKKKKIKTGISWGPVGFPTTQSGKETLNKNLMDNLSGEDEFGYTIHSYRAFMQFQTYIRKRNKQGFDTGKTEAQDGNYDDLVMATALAFQGIKDSVNNDPLLPISTNKINPILGVTMPATMDLAERARIQQSIIHNNDPGFLMPLTGNDLGNRFPTEQEQLEAFSRQIANGAKTINPQITAVKRDYFNYRKQ